MAMTVKRLTDGSEKWTSKTVCASAEIKYYVINPTSKSAAIEAVFDAAPEKYGTLLFSSVRFDGYDGDGNIELTAEYEAQQKAMQQEIARPARDDAAIARMQARMDELYDAIVATAAYRELQAAQEEVNELMNMVNTTIMFQITGEAPQNCTHDCSTCGGCH